MERVITKADTAQGCIYCKHKELKKMETLEKESEVEQDEANNQV